MTIAKYLVTSESFCNHTLIKTTILEAKYTVWKKEFSQEPMQSSLTASTGIKKGSSSQVLLIKYI